MTDAMSVPDGQHSSVEHREEIWTRVEKNIRTKLDKVQVNLHSESFPVLEYLSECGLDRLYLEGHEITSVMICWYINEIEFNFETWFYLFMPESVPLAVRLSCVMCFNCFLC